MVDQILSLSITAQEAPDDEPGPEERFSTWAYRSELQESLAPPGSAVKDESEEHRRFVALLRGLTA